MGAAPSGVHFEVGSLNETDEGQSGWYWYTGEFPTVGIGACLLLISRFEGFMIKLPRQRNDSLPPRPI
ncbi:MAG: hypothetical protein WBX22_03560, partial [Silvibacterium sp.]